MWVSPSVCDDEVDQRVPRERGRACGRRSRPRSRRRRARCRRGRPRRGPSTPWSRARSVAVRLIGRPAPSPSPSRQCRALNAAISCGGADRDPQPARRDRSRGSARRGRAAPCQTACRSANGRTARSWRRSRRPRSPCAAQPADRSRRARAAARRPCPAARRRVPQRRQRGRLGDRREVVGQPDDAERVADRGVGGEVAEPGAGERERLAHGAGDDEVAVLAAAARARSASRRGGTRRTPRRRPPGRCRRARVASTRIASAGSAVPVGLLGDGSSTTLGRCSAIERRARGRGRARSRSSRWPTTQLGEGVAGVLGIHRVRRREATARCGPDRRRPAAAAASPRWSRWPPTPAPASGRRPPSVAEVRRQRRRAARRTRGRGSG